MIIKKEFSERILSFISYLVKRVSIFLLLISLIIIINTERLFAQNHEYDSLFTDARQMLERSMPDEVIPLLIEIALQNSQRKDIVNYAHINLAEAYRINGEHKKATDLLYDVLKDNNLDAYNKAYAYNRMAALYNEWRAAGIHRHDSVEKFSRMCVELSEKNNFIKLSAASQNELAYVFRLKKDNENALIYSRKAYENFHKAGAYPNALNAAINLSGVYLETNEFRKGLVLLDTASQYVNADVYKLLYMRMYLRKSDLYFDINDYKNAFDALHKARKMQENLFLQRMNKQIREMSAKYDLKLKEKEIKEVQHLNKIQKQRTFYLSLLSAVLVSVLLILIYAYRLKRKVREQAETIIKQENAELKASLNYNREELLYKNQELHKAMGNIISFNDSLRKIKQAVIKGDTKIALEIINANRNLEHNWDKFKLSFEEVYPNYIIRLHQKFPNLTENDKKLCAFLLMGMKTLQIANLMGISQSSVSKSRNRLRKKLKLSKGADIAEFLKQFS